MAPSFKHDGYQTELASIVYKMFDGIIGSGVIVNEVQAPELQKPVLKTFKKEKSIQDLNTIFGKQILLKWDHYLILIVMLNI